MGQRRTPIYIYYFEVRKIYLPFLFNNHFLNLSSKKKLFNNMESVNLLLILLIIIASKLKFD